MRYFSRVVLLFAALSSLSISATAGSVGRFTITKRTATSTHNLTSGELYVRSLIAKKPTRRSTAQRRQTSSVPNSGTATLGTDSAGTYTPVGNLVYSPTTSEYTVSSDPASTLILPATPDTTTSNNPIQYVDGSYLALASCNYLSSSALSTFVLGAGSSSYLCVTNVDLGTSSPASTPSVNLDISGNSQLYETAVWNVGSSGSPQWTNTAAFGSTTASLQLVYVTSAYLWPNGKLLAVADVSAFQTYVETTQIAAGYPLAQYPVTIQQLVINVS